MNRVRVKICGVRSLEEARRAIDLGADALGFNFWPHSVRYIAPEDARKIVERLPPFASLVGVFVDEDREKILKIVSQVGLSAVQMHGDETPRFCASLAPVTVIKAVRVGRDFDLSALKDFPVSAVLLDTGVEGSYGGTGRVFDWRAAIEAKRIAPIILAGGLTADNVTEAVSYVRPYGLDVCSGVEAEPGRKDLVKLEAFMKAVASANSVLSAVKEPGS